MMKRRKAFRFKAKCIIPGMLREVRNHIYRQEKLMDQEKMPKMKHCKE